MMEERWELAGLSLESRLLLGTARYPSRQVLLEALDGLERDLHQHIHEENNVLFPRLRAHCGEAQPQLAG